MRRSVCWVLAAAIGGCAAEPPRAPPPVAAPRPPPSPSERLEAAISASDLEGALAALCDAYAAGGMPCAETVHLELLAKTDVMSRAGVLHQIAMPPMPARGEGLAYWDNWSSILSGGAWQAHALFADDEEARLVANMLLVSVLAHELGHHVGSRFRCARSGPAEELQADEISLALMDGLLRPRLTPLHAKMRGVADAMIAAVPVEGRVVVEDDDVRAWVLAQPALPRAVASYVTLHLSRQRALLRRLAPFASVARTHCLDPLASRMTSRSVRPGRVATVWRSPASADATDLVAIAPDARVWIATALAPITVRPLDGGAPPSTVTLPDDASDIVAFAAAGSDRFALADFHRVWRVEGGVVTPVGRTASSAVALAFDEAGGLHAAFRDDTTWSVAPVGDEPRPAELVLRVDTKQGPWADGALAAARASPTLFARWGTGAGAIAFVDAARDAVRVASADGVATLAGSVAGRRDGAAGDATFFGIDAIGRLANGDLAVAERDFVRGGTVVRVVAR